MHEKEYTITVPKLSNIDYKGARVRVPSKTLHRYTEELSKHFGGATVAPKQIGCWFNQWAEPPKHECEEVMRIIVARELDTGDSWPIDPESNEKVASEVRMNQLDREL